MHWLDRYRVVRRLLLAWAAGLITWVCYRVFMHLDMLTGSVAAALATVVGILATVIGFYTQQRFSDDRKD